MASTHITQLKSKLKSFDEEIEVEEEASSHMISKLTYEKEIEDLNKQLESMEKLECQALQKTLFADYLELKTIELLCLSHDAKCEAETNLNNEMDQFKNKIDSVTKRGTEALAEIAILKSELNRERSRIGAAEATEARINGIKSGLYRAIEKSKFKRTAQGNEAEREAEHEALMMKAELENVKRELETAKGKMGELRRRAEQAKTRAEAAEKAKLKMEDEFKKWGEQRERRRAAFASLREECEQREYRYHNNKKIPESYHPLGKVLNIKF